MAVLCTISYVDAQGQNATNEASVADAAGALALAIALKKLTNCQIVSVSVQTPVDISSIPSNTASAANVESALFKMVLSFSAAPPAGATRRPTTTLQVPAPVGSYVNGLTGDPNNADIVAVRDLLKSSQGVQMTKVDKVAYVR